MQRALERRGGLSLVEDNKREEVMARTVQAELDRNSDRKGYAVIIDVEKVMPMSGQTPMQSRDS